MILKELKIENLYGFMNKSITFKDNISILVGINGSGKTSVLNIINWLLKPSIQNLCLIEFKTMSLTFIYNNDKYELICTQKEIEIVFELANTSKGKTYNPIQATFKIHPSILTKDENLKDQLTDTYVNLEPEESEIETWKFLFNELPKPIVVGLDRNLYTEEGETLRIQEEKSFVINNRITRNRKFTSSSPLDVVKGILNREYNSYRNKTLSLYSSLNEKIMLSSFDDVFTTSNIIEWLNSSAPTVSTIDLLKKQVIDFLQENNKLKNELSGKDENIGSQKKVDINKKINIYFDNLKKIVKEANKNEDKNDLLFLANVSQFKKINDLVVEFSQFEEDTRKLYYPLKQFLETINSFFEDSSKELYFDKEISEIKFSILDRKGKKIESDRDIKNLSSGEKQILILLTYLRYNNNKLFIIDEPELSLHPKWQGEFLDAVNKLMPKESQLIIATHSPEIIGEKKQYCSVLLPYNK